MFSRKGRLFQLVINLLKKGELNGLHLNGPPTNCVDRNFSIKKSPQEGHNTIIY